MPDSREGGAIVNREEATELASRWLGGAVELREFDEGWVAWPAGPGSEGVLPDRVGDARVVVERETGVVTSWPPLPVEEIIARRRTAPVGRFPEDVEAHLRKAGWYPGRSIPDEDIDRYAERLHDLTVDDPPVLGVIDAAREVLREFGGLTIARPGWTIWRVQPVAEDPDLTLACGLDEALSQRTTPVGVAVQPDGLEIVMSEDGRVFFGSPAGHGHYLVGDTFDWALIRSLRGEDRTLPWVASDGSVHYTDYAGEPIDPASTRRPSGA